MSTSTFSAESEDLLWPPGQLVSAPSPSANQIRDVAHSSAKRGDCQSTPTFASSTADDTEEQPSLLGGHPASQQAAPGTKEARAMTAGSGRKLCECLRKSSRIASFSKNPPGILDVGLDGILSEMGGLGYETQCFDIPACAVDSPQLRHRIWIVGFMADTAQRGLRANGGRTEAMRRHPDECDEIGSMADAGSPRREGQERSRPAGSEGQSSGYARECDHNLADSAEPGREGRDSERAPDGCGAECAESVVADARLVSSNTRRDSESSGCEGAGTRFAPDGLHWSNSVWVPCADGKLRRAPNDSFSVVDGLHRSLLGALGNSIVPQVALEILRAIRKELD